MVRVEAFDWDELDQKSDTFTKLMVDEMADVLDDVASQVEASDPLRGLQTRMRQEWTRKVNDVLMPELRTSMDDAANDVQEQLQSRANSLSVSENEESVTAAIEPEPGATEIPLVRDEVAERYLASRRNFLVNFADTVWTLVRRTLLQGMQDGESVAELSDRIRDVSDVTSGRAERIARTEVVGASNAGAMAQMESAGLESTKEWLATNDLRTRDSHRRADGQVVDLNNNFTVGGVRMSRPHDPTGPANEVVNCRCTMIFDVADEALAASAFNTEATVTTAELESNEDVETEVHTSGVIALVPSNNDLDRLTIEGGEPRDELHLTLYFLGDAVNYDDATRDAMVSAIEANVSTMESIIGRAFGINFWNPTGDEPAWVLAVSDADGDSLPSVRDAMINTLQDKDIDLESIAPSQHSPWVPHVTIAYGTDPTIMPELEQRLGEITFDRVRLAFGDDVRDIPLATDGDTLTSAAGGSNMPLHKVEDHDQCPIDTPWAVVNNETGEVEECYATEAEADEKIGDKTVRDDDDDESTVDTYADDGDVMIESEEQAGWRGVLAVEGVTTGDGREFAPGKLEWAELPIPLRWNKEDSHGGELSTTTAVNVGKITEVWRDNEKIMGRGVFNLDSEDGKNAFDLVEGEFLRGVSVDLDDISDADVELVFPEGESDEDDDLVEMLMMPEKVIFHGGRIRAATLVDIPAFVEAFIELSNGDGDDDSSMTNESLTFGAVGTHKTATSDASWDGPANEKQLPSPMPMSKARAAYAWIADGAGDDDGVTKSDCKFIHHEVDSDGNVGPANLTACSTGIAALNGARGGTTIPSDQRRGVYNHLAAHLRDANQEPPPANFDAVTASAEVDERPPREWFENPRLSLPTGITVTDEGRVYGHAAMWGECHVGFPDVCVTPPFEDYHPYFMTGEAVCADGSRVAVGQVTLGTGHASLSLGASRAAEHYDNTGAAVADVSIGNDDYGIWVAGALRPDATATRVRDLRASGQLSGDWRRIGGELRLVGLLAVNVPGFPIPKLQTRVASGQPLSLVAAGRPTFTRPVESADDLQRRAMLVMRDRLKQRVHASSSANE